MSNGRLRLRHFIVRSIYYILASTLKGVLLILIGYMFQANCLGAISVRCLYGDVWHPVSQLNVLLVSAFT